MAAFGVEAAFNQVADKGLHGGGVLGRVIDDALRMLGSAQFDARSPEHHHPVIVAHARPVDLGRDQIEMRVVGQSIRVPGLRQCLDRQDTADFDRPSPDATGMPVLGSRTALPNFRVAMFIIIRFTAHSRSGSPFENCSQDVSGISLPAILTRMQSRSRGTLPPWKSSRETADPHR